VYYITGNKVIDFQYIGHLSLEGELTSFITRCLRKIANRLMVFFQNRNCLYINF